MNSRAALGVPVAVGVSPGAAGRGVLVVGDGVGHAAVEQQALYAMALPASPGIGWRAVDREAAVSDGDDGGHGRERATPVALMGCVIHKEAQLEWRAPSKDKRRALRPAVRQDS